METMGELGINSGIGYGQRFIINTGKKFSGMMIKKISVKGKALREEVVLERVCGELAETFKV